MPGHKEHNKVGPRRGTYVQTAARLDEVPEPWVQAYLGDDWLGLLEGRV